MKKNPIGLSSKIEKNGLTGTLFGMVLGSIFGIFYILYKFWFLIE